MRPKPLALTLSRLRRIHGAPLTIGAVVDLLGERSVPLIIVLLGLVGLVPSPGIPVGAVFGTIIALIAWQALMRDRPVRLPGRLARQVLPPALTLAIARHGAPLVRRLERHARERLGILLDGPGRVVVGFILLLSGVLLALPIPFGNTLPAAAIVLLGAGLMWRDGALVAFGLAMAAIAAAASVALVAGLGLAATHLAGMF